MIILRYFGGVCVWHREQIMKLCASWRGSTWTARCEPSKQQLFRQNLTSITWINRQEQTALICIFVAFSPAVWVCPAGDTPPVWAHASATNVRAPLNNCHTSLQGLVRIDSRAEPWTHSGTVNTLLLLWYPQFIPSLSHWIPTSAHINYQRFFLILARCKQSMGQQNYWCEGCREK